MKVDSVLKVLSEVLAERELQHAKWGEQNPPDAPRIDCDRLERAFRLGMPTAPVAKLRCDTAFRNHEGTWAHILVEEVAEAVEAAPDPKALRAELIQVAVVAVAWVEAIDRREEAKNVSG